MKRIDLISLCLFILIGCTKSPQSVNSTTVSEIPGRVSDLREEEIDQLKRLNINFQFRASCYAYSSKKNAIPDHGEAHSDNLPEPVDASFPKNGLYLTINQKELTRLDSQFLGCKLYLVNTSDTLVTLRASDSRLYILAEALNKRYEWVPISYFHSSFCGNSRHSVKLEKDEYWSFNVPVFEGTFKTKLRYALILNNDLKILSNEIVAYLNNDQFDKNKKQGRKNTNLMDPYW